jgi:hypothetical protein
MLFSVSILFLFMYLRAILCTFQISVYFYYVPVGGKGGAGEGGWNLYCTGTVRILTFLGQMALAKVVAISGPKNSRFLGPSPLKWPLLWICPPQNH